MDNHKNFARSTVATAPSPASSGTSVDVAAGEGALFPAAPFNVTIWPAGQQPTAANAEIARVTAKSTDTLTITRAQEGSSALAVIVGDQIAATVTAKTLTDIEAVAGGLEEELFTASGTDNNASATNVATYSLASQLGASDILIVRVRTASGTQQTGEALIYNATDSVTIRSLNNGGPIAAGASWYGESIITSDPTSLTAIQAATRVFRFAGGAFATSNALASTFTTNFTGNWDIALRHGGVTAGGTFHYSIVISRIRG